MNKASHSADGIRWRLLIALIFASLLLAVLQSTGRFSSVVGYLQVPFAAAQGWISGRISGVQTSLAEPRDLAVLQAENRSLRERIVELERQNEELVEMYAEYTLLSALLQYAKSNPDYRRVAADVIGWDTSNLARFLVINKGEMDGVGIGMPVETERGLAGRVVAIGPHAARVQLLTDPGSSVNVRLGASRATGVAVGQLDLPLRVKWMEQDIPVYENELVMTSGLGGNFPPDLIVGRVVSVQKSTSELFQEAEVRPAVNTQRLEIVLVITDFQPALPGEPTGNP